jgi:hypothetical protein
MMTIIIFVFKSHLITRSRLQLTTINHSPPQYHSFAHHCQCCFGISIESGLLEIINEWAPGSRP